MGNCVKRERFSFWPFVYLGFSFNRMQERRQYYSMQFIFCSCGFYTKFFFLLQARQFLILLLFTGLPFQNLTRQVVQLFWPYKNFFYSKHPRRLLRRSERVQTSIKSRNQEQVKKRRMKKSKL